MDDTEKWLRQKVTILPIKRIVIEGVNNGRSRKVVKAK